MDHKVKSRVEKVFRQVFKSDDLVVLPETTAKDLDEWTSFTHMQLIAALEEEFGIRFSFEEVRAFSCVGDIERTIEDKF